MKLLCHKIRFYLTSLCSSTISLTHPSRSLSLSFSLPSSVILPLSLPLCLSPSPSPSLLVCLSLPPSLALSLSFSLGLSRPPSPSVSQENVAAVSPVKRPGDGGSSLLQPGQHLHTVTAVRASHRLPPQTPAHRPGAQ